MPEGSKFVAFCSNGTLNQPGQYFWNNSNIYASHKCVLLPFHQVFCPFWQLWAGSIFYILSYQHSSFGEFSSSIVPLIFTQPYCKAGHVLELCWEWQSEDNFLEKWALGLQNKRVSRLGVPRLGVSWPREPRSGSDRGSQDRVSGVPRPWVPILGVPRQGVLRPGVPIVPRWRVTRTGVPRTGVPRTGDPRPGVPKPILIDLKSYLGPKLIIICKWSEAAYGPKLVFGLVETESKMKSDLKF